MISQRGILHPHWVVFNQHTSPWKAMAHKKKRGFYVFLLNPVYVISFAAWTEDPCCLVKNMVFSGEEIPVCSMFSLWLPNSHVLVAWSNLEKLHGTSRFSLEWSLNGNHPQMTQLFSLSEFMWLKPCHKPPMTGNGNHTTYEFMVMTGGWLVHDIVFPTL
jgi:hypothetical protein